MQNFLKIPLLILFCSLLSSCAKVTKETDIIIDTKIQLVEGGVIKQNPNIVSFLFIADTTTHYFKSYEEALSGKISSKIEEQTEDFFVKGVYDQEMKRLVYPEIKELETLCVVCDTIERVYYFRNIKIVPNLLNLYLPLTIKMYAFKEGVQTVKEGVWIGKM